MIDPVVIGWREWASLPDWNLDIRIKADTGDIIEDTLLDLLGYLVLLRVALKRRKHGQETD